MVFFTETVKNVYDIMEALAATGKFTYKISGKTIIIQQEIEEKNVLLEKMCFLTTHFAKYVVYKPNLATTINNLNEICYG